jgi:glycosyltransferase involved in cell wall biosynthesis
VSYERDSRLVFYDHGTSWYSKKSSETGVFLSRLEMTLCCSFASKRVLELYHGHTGSKMVILNPLRPGLQSSIAPPKSLPTGRPLRLGTAGRLVNVKGFGIAIHALAQLKSRGIEAELHIAGTGKLQQTLQGLSKELDVARQTQFHGLVKNMFLFFRDIDIFLCPSIREPFGLVAVEAMGCGCPVICSSVDGLPEIVTHGNTGLCISPTIPINEYTGFGGGLKGIPEFIYNPENDSIEEPRIVDPEKIADSVETIISDKHHFSAMSVAGIEDAKRRFNFRNYLEAVSDILERI